MARLCGVSYAVAAVNGTAALHLTLVTMGVRQGDFVIVPDWTFIATANAVAHAGAIPYLIDVDPLTWTLDAALVEQALRSTPGIKAVIAVHALGRPADTDALLKVCSAAGVPLIEDAAGAIGATYRGRPVGGLAHAACFSFNGNKLVTAGGGGMLVTNDSQLASRAKHLSTQARTGKDYRHDAIGWNYRMTNVSAAIAIAQLERLGEMIGAKRKIADRYDAALAGTVELSPIPSPSWASSNHWLYSVRCSEAAMAEALVAFLNARNIEARPFWRALSSQKPYADAPRVLNGISHGLSGTVVSLPCSSNLHATQQARVIDAIEIWAKDYRMRTPSTAVQVELQASHPRVAT